MAEPIGRLPIIGTAPIIGWALGTMHTALFVLALIVPLYGAGGLDDLLGGLNTLLGLGLYGLLWMLTWWSTSRAVAGIDWNQLTARDTGNLVLRGLRWGGTTGVLFLLALAMLTLVIVVANAAAGRIPGGDPSGFLVGVAAASTTGLLLGMIVAFVLGAVVGATLALLDAMVLLACRRAMERAAGPQG
jgi:hypothetical protein